MHQVLHFNTDFIQRNCEMSFLTMVPPYVLEIVGVFGFGLYVLNYALLTFNRLNSGCRLYFAINILASL
jgi:hypothetical protein